MRVLSLLIICSLPLLLAGEYDRSPSSSRGSAAIIQVGAEVHPICLDRHNDESCPCGFGDDSLCPSNEDDDALEELLLAQDGLHYWASLNLDLNRHANAGRGHALPALAVESHPLRC